MDATQEFMNLRLAAGEYVTAKDIAAACGFSERSILDAIANGKIHGFALNARAPKGEEVITRKRIPRECAIMFLISIATFDADSLVSDFCRATEKLHKAGALQVQGACVKRIQSL